MVKGLEEWNIVWLKRDLRCQDHQAFYCAQKAGSCLALYVVEPEWLQSPEFSLRHLQFVRDSLEDLRKNLLLKLNIPLLVTKDHIPRAFDKLLQQIPVRALWSHQETGLNWSYQRDLRVKSWCRDHSIPWNEFQQFAVHRGLTNRNTWNQKRSKVIDRSLFGPLAVQNSSLPQHFRYNIYDFDDLKFNQVSIEPGGTTRANELLQSFLSERGEHYSKEMSSPNTAYRSCSRLSSHISFGTLSLSSIQKELDKAQSELEHRPIADGRNWSRSLRAFESRLWWHCHFIQKLEREPELEFQNTNRGYDGMREKDFNEVLFKAWCNGETGFPLIDACMRALQKEGWINFRMRAMLVSFSSYQLWLHWRKPALHLAQLFTDFEPGIHLSQVQMQSGVTGINTLRIYSPIKQSIDQDPQGDFIRQYCSELAEVDTLYIHEPHKMPPLVQQMAGVRLGIDYPMPIVDHKEAYRKAKKIAFQWRNKQEVRDQAREVYRKHGSRKNSFFPSQHRRDD